MKTRIALIFFIALPLFFSSCEKDEYLTPADQIAQDLEQFKLDNGLFFCEVFELRGGSWTIVESKTNFSIKSPWFVANNSRRRYRLDALYTYDVATVDGTKLLRVYFR